MRVVRAMMRVVMLAVTAGCATIVNGGGQVISVNTIPMGASCLIDRDGQRLGSIASTPGTFGTDKSRKTIIVTCSKPGYQPVVASNAAHASFTIVGNILLGGVIGLIVDEATGADYDYANTMDLDFPPLPAPPLNARPGLVISANPAPLPTLAAWRAPPVATFPD